MTKKRKSARAQGRATSGPMPQPIKLYRPASATKAIRALDLPDVPRELLDEANHLINVRLNGPEMLIEHLKTAYDFLDKVSREFVSGFSTCTKGCSHCCRMDVQLTAFEAEYIVMATGIPHDHIAPLTTGHKAPCPFQSAGSCSIYAYRPLFCRTYHALSAPELCGIPGAQVRQYGCIGADMGNALYRGVMKWIYFQNDHATGGVIRDIRDFFPHDPVHIRQHLAQ